jgi:peptidoglycan DL-endopeptidase CwlO
VSYLPPLAPAVTTGRRIASVLLAFGLTPGLVAPPAFADPPADLGTLSRQIDAASHRLETVVEQYNEVREDLRVTGAQSAVLVKQIEPLRRAMAARQARIGELAATEYRTGAGALGTLLGAESAEQFADRLLIIERLASQQQRAIAALATARDRYETARHTLAALAAVQRGQQARLAIRKRQIEAEVARLKQLRKRATRLGLREPRSFGRVPAYSAGRAGEAVRFAHAQLGKGYRWAGSGPDAYDCSGLTSAAWGAAGVPLPHNAARQYRAVTRIGRHDLRPGDLVFYYRDIHHVGMYVGDGKIIHAPRFGERIRIQDMDYAPITGYGRPAAAADA